MNLLADVKKIVTEDIPAAIYMLKRSRAPFVRYGGSVEEITEQIISRCFNGTFFQVSLGHFPQFYMRDFGMCVKSLVELGYRGECAKTIDYALQKYMTANKVSTTIDQKGRCVDFFAYGPDSLAFLLHSIAQVKYKLTAKQKKFLEKQTQICFEKVWDQLYVGVKRNTYFASSKDHYKRDASCYDFCMCGLIHSELQKQKLKSPWTTDFEKRLFELYWSGTGFYDDLSKEDYSGDAQTFPFYCTIVSQKNAKEYFTKCVKKIRELELDKPFPLKYTATRNKQKELFFPSLLAPNYEGDAVWVHTGLCYMEVVERFDTKLLQVYVDAYEDQVTKYRNFLEVYTRVGKPYQSFVYRCDESMLWISMFFAMKRKLE